MTGQFGSCKLELSNTNGIRKISFAKNSAPYSANPEDIERFCRNVAIYIISSIEKKIEKYIHKIIQPLLKNVVNEFISLNMGKNLSEVSQFRDFKQNLDKLYGSDTQTVEQKLRGVFS